MEAIRIHEYGDTEVLQNEDVATPEPTDDEVRLRVHAAGVNPVDWKTRQGSAFPVDFPWTVGWDVAGVVDEVGANVDEFEPGDEVYGLVGFPSNGGAYAEAIVASPAELMRKPASLSFEEAAGVPMAALTAWQVLQVTDVRSGRRVLVHAAAGGVGHFAVQFAKQRGAHVIGTASGPNEEYLRDLGVDEYVNYREERFEDAIEPVDAVIDTVGGETFDRSLEILTEGGTIDTIAGGLTTEQEEMAEEHGVEALNTTVGDWKREWFEDITDLLADGTVTPTIDTVIPLANAREAHKLSENGHVRGKVVLNVGE
jgi:NADPH:quinone reductase-like Zn-dependent oxidoreductase